MPNASLNFGFDYRTFFLLRNDSLEIAFFTCLESFHTIIQSVCTFCTCQRTSNINLVKGGAFYIYFFFSLIVNWNVKNSRKSFWKRYQLNQFLINLNPVCCSLKLNKVDAMLKCKIQGEKKQARDKLSSYQSNRAKLWIKTHIAVKWKICDAMRL